MEKLAEISQPFARLTLTTEQAAEATGLSKTWLEQLRCKSRGPKWIKVGARVLYRPEDLSEWLEAHIQQPKAA